MTENEILEKSRTISHFFCNLEEYKFSKTLALYSPIRNEVDTKEIFIFAKKEGKRVLYPKVRRNEICFVEVRSFEDLVSGSFGILEPYLDTEIPFEWIDLFVIPGVGFDISGYRLGYGFGYYDRIFRKINGTLIGLAYRFQVIDEIFHNDGDLRVEKIVTEEGVIDCFQSRKNSMEVTT